MDEGFGDNLVQGVLLVIKDYFNMKQVIKLSESQLKQIVSDTVRQYIKESIDSNIDDNEYHHDSHFSYHKDTH